MEKEYRCLTAEEIASSVKTQRELFGLKQITLAQIAGVTERTIQRLESGHKVDDETLKLIAFALDLAPNAFIGPRVITPRDQVVENVAKFFDRHQFVATTPVSDWRAFEELMDTAAVTIDHTCLSSEACRLVAPLRDYLQECIDISDVLDSTGKMECADQMFTMLREIENLGNTSRYAVVNTVDKLKIGALILLPEGHERASINSALFPTHFAEIIGEGPSEEERRIADLIFHFAKQAESA